MSDTPKIELYYVTSFNEPTSTGIAEQLNAVTEQRDRLVEELDALKQSILDLSHPNMKLLLAERNEAKEQRDKLAEAIRKHRDELKLTSGDSVDRILWNVLDAVEGGKP
jgi:uncharacterized coiled-coil DUF342 family protein